MKQSRIRNNTACDVRREKKNCVQFSLIPGIEVVAHGICCVAMLQSSKKSRGIKKEITQLYWFSLEYRKSLPILCSRYQYFQSSLFQKTVLLAQLINMHSQFCVKV